MKTCLICGEHCSTAVSTCQKCGEASWSEPEEPSKPDAQPKQAQPERKRR